MRVSRVQAAENRQTVIDVASRLFRERGFDGIGLKDLMEGAGLTRARFTSSSRQRRTWRRRRPGGRWRAPAADGQPRPRPIRRIRLAR